MCCLCDSLLSLPQVETSAFCFGGVGSYSYQPRGGILQSDEAQQLRRQEEKSLDNHNCS